VVDCVEQPAGDERGRSDHAIERPRHSGALREPGCLDQPGKDSVDLDAARSELGRERARERELGVFRRRVRAFREDPGDRYDVDDVRARRQAG